MARFSELNELDRIQYIKDGFVLIIEQVAQDPSKLKNYIKLEKPKLFVPALESTKDYMSDEEKKLVAERNAVVEADVLAKNKKLEEKYAADEAEMAKVAAVIASFPKEDGCICGSCLSINITSSKIPPELNVLIDAARKEAEEKAY